MDKKDIELLEKMFEKTENRILGSVPGIVHSIIQDTVPGIVHSIIQDTVPEMIKNYENSILKQLDTVQDNLQKQLDDLKKTA